MKNMFKKIFIAIVIIVPFFTPVTINIGQYTSQISYISAQTLDENGEPVEVSTNEEVVNPELPDLENYLTCGRWEFGCKLLNALGTLTIQVGNFLVGMSAYVMDIFLNHSLQSSSYRGSGFIEQGWEILRDVTNLAFIFALLYIAFNMVLGTGGGDTKKRLIKAHNTVYS